MIKATNPVFYLILVNKALPVTAFCIPVLHWNEYQAGVWALQFLLASAKHNIPIIITLGLLHSLVFRRLQLRRV